MKIYSVEDYSESDVVALAYPSKAEAIENAKRQLAFCPAGKAVEVTEVTLDKLTPRVVCALYNQSGGYVVSRRLVASFPSNLHSNVEE